MTTEQFSTSQDSLFSLELVVEKLYIPHSPCRFPAIAFRLLDYPTILIKHVEDDLGTAIRNKISFDPYYRIPDQFSELKDKHGNFMVKKGKSCLFKMPTSQLKQHLSCTPLYVMIIDTFPEVPKLVASSTVPLNTLMDLICSDIVKVGPTVPSVHGNKGLFKLYSLMGNEIGYFVLGVRLLCLGPSLIPHLPETALIHRQAKQHQPKLEKSVDKIFNTSSMPTSVDEEEPDRELKNSACMTDPVKHDVLLQTVDMEDKATYIQVSSVDIHTNTMPISEKDFKSMAVQTDRLKKVKESMNLNQKSLHFEQEDENDDLNDVIISNIVCPPPLFYNSGASPQVEIKSLPKKYEEQISVEDLSDIESFDGDGLQKSDNSRPNMEVESSSERIGHIIDKGIRKVKHVAQARPGENVRGLQAVTQSEVVFPLLTALVKELSSVQLPLFLTDISNKVQTVGSYQEQTVDNSFYKVDDKKDLIPPSVVSAVASALAKKSETAKDNVGKTEISPTVKVQSPQMRAGAQVKKQEKLAAKPGPSKLVYKLTTTQRLRLQKTNPQWLLKKEQEADTQNKVKQGAKGKAKQDTVDMNATNFSDTLTEVRRLAELELNSTVGGDTLQHIASEADSTMDRSASRTSHKDHKTKNATKRSPAPKTKSRLRQKRAVYQKNANKDSSDSDELFKRKTPVPLERTISGITSPAPPDSNQDGYEDQLSARSDLPSSRSRSIEIHLPSAKPHPQYDDSGSGTITDAEDSAGEAESVAAAPNNEAPVLVSDEDEVDIPLPDDSAADKPQVQVLNFPRYISREDSLPETIIGAHNASLKSSVVEGESPLESTRHSYDILGTSKPHQSTTDMDSRQFHSTDEPELQGLVSEEDNYTTTHRRSITETAGSTVSKFPVINPQQSQNSPVPSVRRSTSKLDPTTGHTHSMLPSMSMSKGLTSPVSSRPGTPKSGTAKVTTPRTTKLTPRTRQRRPLRESIHTDSLSSYVPSDPENVLVSLSSSNKSGASYSDDFLSGGESEAAVSSVEQLPKIISSAKLGYTIN